MWGLRTEMTKGKVRIPMSPGQLVVGRMGDKIGFKQIGRAHV